MNVKAGGLTNTGGWAGGPHVGFTCGAFDFSTSFHSLIKLVSPRPTP